MDFEEAVKKAIEESEDRNFTESIDMVVNLTDLDLSNPENRINEDIKLPYQADEDVKVAIIGDSVSAENADIEISESELENEYFDEPNNAKDLADEVSFILAEAPLMPKIGAQLGQVLGPRNMMPDPVPPGSDVTDQIEALRSTVTIRLKEEPILQIKIGNEEHDVSNVARNGTAIYELLASELEQGSNNIKNILVKTTMGPTVEVKQ